MSFLATGPLPTPKTLGECIRFIRVTRGLIAMDAAAEFGVDPTALLAWEKDQGTPENWRCRGKLQGWLERIAALPCPLFVTPAATTAPGRQDRRADGR